MVFLASIQTESINAMDTEIGILKNNLEVQKKHS